ncbi:hypothetical protein BJ742DRAFT_874635 [Cladochytrium replicatum]|nr:hypothetical protein BJ742DRAFT_874635 [Cladochytrium replicatum]
MGAYRVWRAGKNPYVSLATRGPDLYLEPKGYMIPHPHASSASYKRNRSTSMGAYRVWRAGKNPYHTRMRVARHTSGIEAHRCWYTESGEQVRIRTRSRMRVAPHTSGIEVHRWGHTESGEQVRIRTRLPQGSRDFSYSRSRSVPRSQT